MKKNILLKCLLVGVIGSMGALADITADRSNGVLTVTSSTSSGAILAKIVGPNDEVIINEKSNGNSFSWTPSVADGIYRYDVRIKGEHTGGSVKVKNGKILKRGRRK